MLELPDQVAGAVGPAKAGSGDRVRALINAAPGPVQGVRALQ